MACGPDEGEHRGLAAPLHVGCTEGRCLHLEDHIRFDVRATLFAVERVTGIEPALSAWEEFLSPRVSVSCNDIGGLN